MSKSRLSKHGPVLLAATCLWIAAALTLATSVRRNDGRFVPALDDTYIHMAVSNSLAQHGVWGIDGRQFASCSSSPLWTVLLAGCFLPFGAHPAIPAVLALLCATGVLIAGNRLLAALGMNPQARAATLIGLAFAAPLVTLVFVANEHALHTLLTLAFAYAGVRAITDGAPRPAVLALLAALTVATRYEGMIAVGVVAALLALRGRWRSAASAFFGGLVPIAAFGAWFLSQGGSFLPTSVLLKAKYPLLDLPAKLVAYLGPSAVSEALKTPELAALVLGAAILAAMRVRRMRTFWDPATVLLAVFSGTALAHMDFARTGEFFRYEAYLIALGILAIGAALSDARRPQRAAAALIAALIVAPLAWRAVRALRDTPIATANIYQQQIQMATFVREHYAGSAVAVNDIGAVAFLGNVRVVDLWGLADREVAHARRLRAYGPETMRRVVRRDGAEVAAVYERWFERFGGVPDDWIRVRQWTIPDNKVCGNPTVSFFATVPEARERLEENLRAFESRLPPQVDTR